MAHPGPETVDALNALLQDERASVEVTVALSTGATERSEREAFASMGGEEVAFCSALHEWLEAAGLPVTRHVNGIVLTIINAEQYDERLYAFAVHQRESGEQAHRLSGLPLNDRALQQLLEAIYEAHIHSARWCEERAAQFANSRTLEFRSGSGQPASENAEGVTAAHEPDASASDASGEPGTADPEHVSAPRHPRRNVDEG